MNFRVFLIVFLALSRSFICNSQEKDTVVYYTKTDKVEAYVSDSINVVFDKIISIVQNDSTFFHDLVKKECSEIDTYIEYYNSKSGFDSEFYGKEQIKCDESILNFADKLKNYKLISIELVSGKKEEFDEFVLRRLELAANEYKCFNVYYRNPSPMRLNTNALTFWEIDNGARKFLGIHRINNKYLLVVPMFYQNIYFADIHIELGNPSN